MIPADLAPPGVLERYRPMIGRRRDEVLTPALLLDLDVARRNQAAMTAGLAGGRAGLRPHVKTHKSPHLARMQIEAGAVGVAVATVWEAQVMASAGIEDVLVANQVVGREKVAAAAETARRTRLSVAVDDPRNLADLSAAAVAAGSVLDVLVEVDVGMERGGVRSVDEAVRLARDASSLPGLRLRGIQGYEGHCTLEPDPGLRRAKADEAAALLWEVSGAMAGAGVPAETVSAGGTGTYHITSRAAGVTEIQAGTYILMDAFHATLVSDFAIALTVAATVSVRHGRTVVLDAGRKSVGIDFVTPPLVGHDVEARYYAEEHALFDFPGAPPLDLGDRVEVVPGYCPTTVNLHDAYHVLEDDVVVDVWPIVPRGPGPWRWRADG